MLGGTVEESAILAEHGINIGIFAAPITARGEIDDEVIEADAELVEVLPYSEPNVLALRHALRGVHRVADGVRRVSGQIPAAINAIQTTPIAMRYAPY